MKNKRYIPRDVNGILLLNKPKNFSSNQVLQKIKHLFQAKKAGHTGSLDPLATGMLPICFGEATKFSQFLLNADKAYYTTIKLGVATTTADAEGEIIQIEKVLALSEKKISQVLQRFIGTIEQIPPMYSALKYQGKPLYKLARQGIEIERKIRTVTIHDIKLLKVDETLISLEVCCSKGTYIRTLAEDIAKALNTIGHVQLLDRLWVAPFNEQQQYDLDYLESLNFTEELDNLLLSTDYTVRMLPKIILNDTETKKLQCGQFIQLVQSFADQDFRVYHESGVFLGVGRIIDHKLYANRLVQIKV